MSAQIVKLAEIWAEANQRSLARLATIVLNRGSFFDKLEGGAGCTVDTIEKFLLFFRDGANWPEGHIPLAASDLLDNFANIATEQLSDSEQVDAASPGKGAVHSPCADSGREAVA